MLKGLLFILLLQSVSATLNTSSILTNVNGLRALHGAPPVTWDDNIAAVAQSWANYLNANKLFQHSTNSYGENIAFVGNPALISNPTSLVNYAVSLWYGEYANYNYNQPGFGQNTGHFTQLVWVSTTKIGAGVASDPSSGISYIVMNFDPPGNYDGQFTTNVLPISSSSPRQSPLPPPSPNKSPRQPPMPIPSPRPSSPIFQRVPPSACSCTCSCGA